MTTQQGLLPHMPDWGTLPSHTNTVKVSKLQKTAIAMTLTVDLCAILLGMAGSILPGKGVVHWNLQWDILRRWASYFAPLGEEEPHNLHWDPIVLLQAGLVEIHYTLNGTHTTERGEKVRVLSGSTASASSPGKHVWYMQLGQIPKAAATLVSKDQAVKSPIQVPNKCLFKLRPLMLLQCPVTRWTPDESTFLQWSHLYA